MKRKEKELVAEKEKRKKKMKKRRKKKKIRGRTKKRRWKRRWNRKEVGAKEKRKKKKEKDEEEEKKKTKETGKKTKKKNRKKNSIQWRCKFMDIFLSYLSDLQCWWNLSVICSLRTHNRFFFFVICGMAMNSSDRNCYGKSKEKWLRMPFPRAIMRKEIQQNWNSARWF